MLCAGVAGRFLYRFVAHELDWQTDKAVRISVLRHAEEHVTAAKIFRSFPTKEEGDTLATIIVMDINQSAEDEVYSAKQQLLWLYQHKGRSLSAEEAAQVAQWQKDVAAWKAVNVRP